MGVSDYRYATPLAWAGWLAPFLVIGLSVAGCDRQSVGLNPEEGPAVVVKRFYEHITEATKEGGSSSARLAYKLIGSERSRLSVEAFLEVIKKYPPGLAVDVGKVEINGTHALVDISYQMPSLFDEAYKVRERIPLNVDEDVLAWRIDFTGETYGMDKEAALTLAKEGAPGMLEVGLGEAKR